MYDNGLYNNTCKIYVLSSQAPWCSKKNEEYRCRQNSCRSESPIARMERGTTDDCFLMLYSAVILGDWLAEVKNIIQ